MKFSGLVLPRPLGKRISVTMLELLPCERMSDNPVKFIHPGNLTADYSVLSEGPGDSHHYLPCK